MDLLSAVERSLRMIGQNPQIGASYKATRFRYYVVHGFPRHILQRSKGRDLDRRSGARETQAGLLESAADGVRRVYRPRVHIHNSVVRHTGIFAGMNFG
jgi:hypothetical protein